MSVERPEFAEYLIPDDETKRKWWKEALFVLDTNILLNAYRYPPEAAGELLGALESIQDRLWIPHRVALEFHRHRLDVSRSRGAAMETLSAKLAESVRSLVKNARDKGLRRGATSTDSDDLADELVDAVKNVLDGRVTSAATSDDDVDERVHRLLRGRTGPPAAAKVHAKREAEAIERLAAKVPPGFLDFAGTSNSGSDGFVHRGLRYRSDLGDAMWWLEVLEHVANGPKRPLIVVTDDQKEDWWWRVGGHTLGPRPELRERC